MATGPAEIRIEIDVTKLKEVERYEQTTGVIGLVRTALEEEEKLIRIHRGFKQPSGKVVAQLTIPVVRITTEGEDYLRTQFRAILQKMFGEENVLMIEIFRLQ